MHKITKGLKKKKKGKKSKHKDEELFKPEELEAYRREHQEAATSGQNEEWKKFNALTSGVDDILKKTQGDLDRIKSTSFFQRVPTSTQIKKQEAVALQAKQAQEREEEATREATPAELGIVEVLESESEEDEDDDIFDTAYIDAIAAGDVKLAYIPESPTEDAAGDDPFDTTIAEKAILGPVSERKGKKLVPIGAAVEVLTGRVQIPTCATVRPPSNRRQILKEKDLLLGSFDDNANSIPQGEPIEVPKTLLDEDAPPLEEPIDLSKTLYIPPVVPITLVPQLEDEDDEDFALLAAESLTKTPVAGTVALPPKSLVTSPEEKSWAAFDATNCVEEDEVDVDPFDTTFADNILPGKAELKQIECEILENDIDFNPRAEISNKVSINVTDPAGKRGSISSLDRVSEAELNLIKPIHRDLLGGSNTDLSNLGDLPLRPSEQIDNNYIEYCDPFDTSIIETAAPGQTELKFIEKELLGDLQIKLISEPVLEEDEDFDPRAGEPPARTQSRPDVLNFSKTVSFDLPSSGHEGDDDINKIVKPLTPFYVRKSSIGQQVVQEEETPADPFDTSFVCDIKPGKVELKLIENELFDPNTERKLALEDQDFDPRDGSKVRIEQVVQSIKDIANNKVQAKALDLLDTGDDTVVAKVLTPAAEPRGDSFGDISYSDPFDTTTIGGNILPGKTELKLLEAELIEADQEIDDFDPRAFDQRKSSVDLLDNASEIVIRNPLNPGKVFEEIEDEVDPFDTSIANNIVPGKTELKLLESELM